MFTKSKRLGVWAALLLSVQLAFAGVWPPNQAQAADTDLTTQQKLDALIKAGIFDKDDTSSRLDASMSREQLAVILAKLKGLQEVSGSSFTDVAGDRWSAGFINAVSKANLMVGMNDGSFAPAGNITLEQLATVAAKVLGLQPNTSATVEGNVSDWAKGYVAAAIANGLLPPRTDFTASAAQSDLVNTTYQTNSVLVCGSEPKLAISETQLDLGGKNGELKLAFTTAVDPNSVRLNELLVNGVRLDSNRDKYALSEDGKSLTVTLGEGFAWKSEQKDSVVEAGAIQSKCGKPMPEAARAAALKVVNEPPAVTNPPTNESPSSSPDPSSSSKPSIRIDTVTTVTYSDFADVSIISSKTETIYYIVLFGSESDLPPVSVDDIISVASNSSSNSQLPLHFCGIVPVSGTPTSITIPGLNPFTSFTLYAVGVNGSRKSSKLTFNLDDAKPYPP